MKNLKNILAISMALLVPAMLVSGCASTDPQPQSGDTSSKQSTAEAPSSGGGAGAQAGSIKFLLTYPKEKTVLYECLDEFTAKTGIGLEIQYMPLTDERKQINIMVASESLPDVMDVDNTDTASYAQMGILADITDLVNSDIELDKYYPQVLGQSQYEGKYYGMPFTSNNLCLYYNKDLFQQAGIGKIPESWEELFDAAGKLLPLNVVPFGVAGGKNTDTSFQMWPFIWMAGADAETLDSPEGVAAMDFYKKMVDNKYMSVQSVNYNAGDNANQFIAGKTAMVVDGPWRINAIKKDATFEYGVAKLPAGPNGFATVLGGHNFAIVDNEKVAASWEFVKYMNEPEVMLKYSEAENYVPSRKDVSEKSEYFSSEPMKTFVEMAEYSKAMPTKNYNKISDTIIEMMQSVVMGAKTPEQAAKDGGGAIASIK